MNNIIDVLKMLLSNGFDFISIVIGFIMAVAVIYWKEILRIILKKAKMYKEEEALKAELYAIDSARRINEILSDIVSRDPRISNVILCNYHNGASSDANFSYYYFTSVSEAFGNTTNPCFDIWREKSYINFQPELHYIHQKRSAVLNINSKEDVTMLPKFTNLVIQSKANVGLFVPISGIRRNIGMLTILFKDDINIDNRGDYICSLTSELEQLALLLDYRKHSDKYKCSKKK